MLCRCCPREPLKEASRALNSARLNASGCLAVLLVAGDAEDVCTHRQHATGRWRSSEQKHVLQQLAVYVDEHARERLTHTLEGHSPEPALNAELAATEQHCMRRLPSVAFGLTVAMHGSSC